MKLTMFLYNTLSFEEAAIHTSYITCLLFSTIFSVLVGLVKSRENKLNLLLPIAFITSLFFQEYIIDFWGGKRFTSFFYGNLMIGLIIVGWNHKPEEKEKSKKEKYVHNILNNSSEYTEAYLRTLKKKKLKKIQKKLV